MNVRARIDLLRRKCGELPERVVPVRVWLPRKEGGEPPGIYPVLGRRVVRVADELASVCITGEPKEL